MLYDPVTQGFYSTEIHGDAVPATAVPLTDAAYFDLLAALEAGQVIATDAGGYPVAIDPPATSAVPASVSRFQARAALMQAGLLDAVEAAIAASGDPFIRLAWAEANEVSRTSPTIAAMAAALDLSEAQVDALFIAAAQIFA